MNIHAEHFSLKKLIRSSLSVSSEIALLTLLYLNRKLISDWGNLLQYLAVNGEKNNNNSNDNVLMTRRLYTHIHIHRKSLTRAKAYFCRLFARSKKTRTNTSLNFSCTYNGLRTIVMLLTTVLKLQYFQLNMTRKTRETSADGV